ncbi:MAG: tripartite tricarboxylate transporter substrate binding protein [Betaproteobacteria bacterium]|nr:tripartite tricarboxylate transporter substrate binding protein [Betaproteobacteria bacterium]
MPSIKQIAAVAVLLLLAVGQSLAQQSYPNKPIRFLLPYPPGGSTDIFSRIVTQKLSESLGQQVVVENRPGGNSIIGTDALAKAAPDGYTIGLVATTYAINPSLFKLPYDPAKDLIPIIQAGFSSLVLVVHPSVPAKTLKEFLAYAKANPGKLNYGTVGSGSITHLASELFEDVAGIDTVNVPYKGTAPMVTDLIGGQLHYALDTPVTSIPHLKSGKLRGVAVASAKRSSAMPDIPTMVEAGLPFEISAWLGIMAPAGTPKEIVSKLNAEINKILQMPDVRERLAASALEPGGGDPEQLAAVIKTDLARWPAIVKKANVKVE